MGKTQEELEELLRGFTQKFSNQNDVFEKIEKDYLYSKNKNDFLNIVRKYHPQTIPFAEFNQAYQWWRRSKEKEKKILNKMQEIKDCFNNHLKNLTYLGGGDPELGREFEEKYLYE